MKTILGIDPGISGAIVSISDAEKIVYDMPTIAAEKNGKIRRIIDNKKLLEILRSENPTHIFLEEVGYMPGNGGVAMFSFGRGFGNLETAAYSIGIEPVLVRPNDWKSAMCCPADKNASRRRASELLPDMAHNWDLKKHDGRAEAAMIALYGWGRV